MSKCNESFHSGEQSDNRVSRRNTLKLIGASGVGIGAIPAMTGVAAAAFSMDFTIYTGEGMKTVADFLNEGTFGPAIWVKDSFDAQWPNVSNISDTSGTVPNDLVPTDNFSTSSCGAFLRDFDDWLAGRSDASSDTNVLLSQEGSVGCGGIAEPGCEHSDSADACVVFSAGEMYSTDQTVKDSYEFDSDENADWDRDDWGHFNLSTAFMEGGHNLGLGHSHGDADAWTSPPTFTPMMGGYADTDTSPNCCGEDNYCGVYVDCIEIYNDNCKVDYTLTSCTEDEGAYPGYPFCPNDNTSSCPTGQAIGKDGRRYAVSVPSPYSGEEPVSVPTPDHGSRRTMSDARKRQRERGPFASETIIPYVTERYSEQDS